MCAVSLFMYIHHFIWDILQTPQVPFNALVASPAHETLP